MSVFPDSYIEKRWPGSLPPESLIRCGHPDCAVKAQESEMTRCEGDQWRCSEHHMTEVIDVMTPRGKEKRVICYTFADYAQMLDDDDQAEAETLGPISSLVISRAMVAKSLKGAA